MRVFKTILIFVLGLIILGGIFYLGNYVTEIRYSNLKTLEVLKTNPFLKFTPELENLKNNFTFTKDFVFKIVSLLPKIKEDINLKENLNKLIESLNCVSDLTFLKDGLLQKEESLNCLKDLKEKISNIKDLKEFSLENYEEKITALLDFLGENQKKNYLVLIQNPLISRPTGGFLFAYGFLSFDKGKIDFKGGHINDLDNLLIEKIIPPYPLQLITNQWFFHDLNWFYDFDFTALKIIDLYEKNTNLKLDGVILINPEIIEKMMEKVKEVKIKDNETVTENNLYNFLNEELILGMKPAPLREKPLVLDEFLNNLFYKLREISNNDLVELITSFNQFILRKDIQLYFKDKKFEKLFLSNNLAYNFDNNLNFLNVNFSYLDKDFKEDKRLKKIILKTEVLDDLSLLNELIINAEATNPIERKILTYIKVYLPLNAKILEANGFVKVPIEDLTYYFKKLNYQKDKDLELIEANQEQIPESEAVLYKENNRLVIGGFSYLSKQPLIIKYQLPPLTFNEKDLNYPLKIAILKQSGQNVSFLYKLNLPSNLTLYPTLFEFNKWLPLVEDNFLNFKLQKNEF